jgi:phosphatidylethanolamine/phosphatidyl-N-methylethanolamine N-methyltransferase
VLIFSFGIVRDGLYAQALAQQPSHAALGHPFATAAAIALLVAGNVLVLSSMYALGITGTYLGDYFGILMPARVTRFPFSICAAPMYYGSTMNFLGSAIWSAKPAGVFLTAEVLLVYLIALRFEDPFTEGIYRERAERAKGGKKVD